MKRTADNAQKRPFVFSEPCDYAELQSQKDAKPPDSDCHFPKILGWRLETEGCRSTPSLPPGGVEISGAPQWPEWLPGAHSDYGDFGKVSG